MDEEANTCPLCLCDFIDPRALPCLHTFCLSCLSDVLKNLSYEKNSKKLIDCPTCREVHEIPVSGANGFRRNFYFSTSQVEGSSGKRCRIHTACVLTLFCERCEVSICSECHVDTHVSHTVKRISDVGYVVTQKVAELKLMRSRMKEFGTTLSELIADYDKLINYAAKNPLDAVLENLSFESEVLEVCRSSLVIPSPRSQDKEILEIPDDDVLFTGLYPNKVDTAVNPFVSPRSVGSKAKKIAIKSETVTKSGLQKEKGKCTGAIVKEEYSVSTSGAKQHDKGTTTSSADVPNVVNAENNQSKGKEEGPNRQGKRMDPVASTSRNNSVNTPPVKKIICIPTIPKVSSSKGWEEVTIPTASGGTEKSGEKIIIPVVAKGAVGTTVLKRADSTSGQWNQPNRRGPKQLFVPIQVHTTTSNGKVDVKSSNVSVIGNKPGVKFLHAVKRLFENQDKTSSAETCATPKANNASVKETQSSTSNQVAPVGNGRQIVRKACVKTKGDDTRTVADEQTQSSTERSSPTDAAEYKQGQKLAVEENAEAHPTPNRSRGQKRKACTCIACVDGPSRKQKVTKTETKNDNLEQDESNPTFAGKYKITYSSKQSSKTEKPNAILNNGITEDKKDEVVDSKKNPKITKRFALRRTTFKVLSQAEQKRRIKNLWKEGDSPYQITTQWFEQWKKYVGFDSKKAMKEENPGPLITPGTTKAKDTEKATCVPVEVWDSFANWFGVAYK